jgi:hypothetical protein
MTEPLDKNSSWWKRTVGPRASGILQVRTAILPREAALRRSSKLYRPPVAFSLCLLLFGVALGAAAIIHRQHLDSRFGALVVRAEAAPFEIQRIRRELATLLLDEQSLTKELEARLAAVDAQELSEFYLVLDTKQKKLSLRFGDQIVREAPLTVGPPRPIVSASGDRIAAVPISGTFTVRQKLERPAWKAPAWVYAEAGRPVPSPLPVIRGGLGRYVIALTDDVVLHSPPPPESPWKGVWPGSLMAPEQDLAAIWKRIGPETRVHVF